jgi:hypothetical protein
MNATAYLDDHPNLATIGFFLLIVLLVIAGPMIITPASAQTIQMSNPDDTGSRDVIVYWPNGTLYGSYNTTSLITIPEGDSLIFTLKPQGNNAIDDPTNWLTNTAFPWVRSNAVALLLISVFIGFIVGRRS